MIKTVSLETAKLLKEAGFRQNTSMVWRKYQRWLCEDRNNEYIDHGWSIEELDETSAQTTNELLDEMSDNHILDYCNSDDGKHTQNYLMNLYRDPNKLAECWLWLKKEGLI